MPALILCHASEDAALAHALGDYLGCNLAYDICYDDGFFQEGLDLVDATERALSAEAALVLLSPHSVLKSWKREKWEPVFFQKPAEFGSLLGLVMLAECRFPELFRRQRFFDASGDLMYEARRIRRWLLRPHQPVAVPGSAKAELLDLVVHQPGVAPHVDYSQAVTFAKACELDFEAIYRIDCLGRSRAGILGDIGQVVGVRLPGTVPQNRAVLGEWCRSHLCLFLVQNSTAEDREFLDLGGRVSVLFTTNAPARDRSGVEQVAEAFLAVPRDESVCAALVGDATLAVRELLGSDFESGLRLGWGLVTFLRGASRFAEAVEVLHEMEQQARAREDALALYRIGWEQSWLRETAPEGDSFTILPTAGTEVTQLSLF